MKIWILIIQHKYGDNISAFQTQEEANTELYTYVENNWCSHLEDEQGPITAIAQDKAIEHYFEYYNQLLDWEFFTLDSVELTAKPHPECGWQVGESKPSGISIVDENGKEVLKARPRIQKGKDITPKNAFLAAAAPVLLKALELINVDKDGDGFICREGMDFVQTAINTDYGLTAEVHHEL